MSAEPISITTADGICPAIVFTPEGAGPWPAVIFYMDGLGMRPVLHEMCARIARDGYVVLLPDLYYRAGAYAPMDPKEIFANPEARKILAPLMATTGALKAAEDTRAFLDYLDTRVDVRGPKIGTTGYCMGGAMSITAAAAFPDRVAIAASFHGGKLATDDPASPHLLAPKMQGFIYVAGAVEDQSYPPEMAARLDEALTAAHVRHRCEFYPGAKHGWTMADFPIYNPDMAERHFRELRTLLVEYLA